MSRRTNRTDPEPNPLSLFEKGILGDDHWYTPEIRHRANQIVKSVEWPIFDIDLSKVTFLTNSQAKGRNGHAQYKRDGRVVIEVSEHVIDNAGWEAAESVIRHELVHVWQHQHRGETVRLPNGSIVEDVDTGHTGSWYEWEELLDISRTNRYYQHSKSDFKYIIQCRACGYWYGRHRLSKHVRLAASGHLKCPKCDNRLYLYRPDKSLALGHGDWSDSVIKKFVNDDVVASDNWKSATEGRGD